MSPELYEALKAWLKEAESDRPDRRVRVYGLCSWVESLSGITGISPEEEELAALFRAEFDDCDYPFNNNTFIDYGHEQRCEVLHLNTQRLAWVRRKIEEYEMA